MRSPNHRAYRVPLMKCIQRVLFSTLLLVCSGLAESASAQFSIHLNYAASVTNEQKIYFDQAAALWESYILGYQPGISLTGITINVSTPELPAGQLGQANASSTVSQGGYYLTSTGYMQFNSTMIGSLIDQGWFDEVIVHEMGHVIGFGIQWISNGVYKNGSGQYTGEYGVAAYNHEYGQNGTYVPVELLGGIGTANKHWAEVEKGAALTGITDLLGRDMAHELMTGWLNVGRPPYISNTTLQSLRDIGFVVVDLYAPAHVPEPAALVLCGLAVGIAAYHYRRVR